MRVRVYCGGNAEENYVLNKFAEGCPITEDVMVLPLGAYHPSDLAVVFGTFKKNVPVSFPRGRVVQGQKELGLDTVIIETGYLNRGAGPDHHYAVGLNGLNGRADFRNADSPDDRAERFKPKVKPWRADGEHIVLCGQVPWDASCDFIDIVKWADETAIFVKTLTEREIVYRPHPLVKTPTPVHCRRSNNYWLQDDLENAWCVVTFNSNSGVEAIMDGIPAVATDPGSMIMGVETNIGQVDNPRMPDRCQWLANLCYAQWTPREMEEGSTWTHLFG
jgi:hypothetical protein